jgi:HEAT repeat protein
VDAALEESLDDASREVRAPAVLALGERRAIAHADAVRARLEDGDEDIGVRTNAAIALGLMCDSASLDVLTDQARRLRDPGASPEARALAPVALGALGRIHPPDLQRRLGPLLDEGAPPLARRAALATLREPGGCGRRATTR